MDHSISFEGLTPSQRRTFAELGIGPKDRVYVRALSPLSDETLLKELAAFPDASARVVSRALATRFRRHHTTIQRRLRHLALPGPSGKPSSAGASKEARLAQG